MSPAPEAEYNAFRCGEHASQLAAFQQWSGNMEKRMQAVEDGDRTKAALDKKTANKLILWTAGLTGVIQIVMTLITIYKK